MKIYGIVGTFFQEGQRPAIVHGAESEGGTHVKLHQEATSHVFSGHFAVEDGRGEGNMIDGFGPSRLSIERFSDDTIYFYKEYLASGTIVEYLLVKLKPEGDLWKGDYRNMEVGSGTVICRMFELEESVFNIDPAAHDAI